MVRILFAILLLVLPVTGVRAECRTATEVIRSLKENAPSASLNQLEGSEAAAFMQAFNALPPTSEHVADAIVLVSGQDLPGHLMFAFHSGCLIGRAALSAGQYTLIMNHVAGTGA